MASLHEVWSLQSFPHNIWLGNLWSAPKGTYQNCLPGALFQQSSVSKGAVKQAFRHVCLLGSCQSVGDAARLGEFSPYSTAYTGLESSGGKESRTIVEGINTQVRRTQFWNLLSQHRKATDLKQTNKKLNLNRYMRFWPMVPCSPFLNYVLASRVGCTTWFCLANTK